MNKLTVVSLGALFVAINLATTYFFSGYLLGNTIDKLKMQITQLSSDSKINQNELNKRSNKKIQKSEIIKSPAEVVIVDVESKVNPTEDLRFNNIDKELKTLKLQFNLFNEMTTATLDDLQDKVNISLVSNQTEESNNSVNTEPVTMEMRMEASRIASERTESSYESLLLEGDDDSWSTEIEDSISNLIDTDELGIGIQLLGVKCSAQLCKVNILNTKNALKDDKLLMSLGNSTIYMNKKEDIGAGQEETVMYISRPGERLPRVIQ